VIDTFIGKHSAAAARGGAPALLTCALLLAAAPLRAEDAPLPTVSVGGGVRTSFQHDAPDGANSTDSFLLNSVRLYVNGSVTRKIKLMFNTE
jgi:hypothetical protein